MPAAGATLGEFLDELCAPSRGPAASGGGVPDCLVVAPGPPSTRLRALLARPGVKRHTMVLAANLLDGRDLVGRCAADKAACAFILADLCSSDPEAQDQEAIVTAAALHRACPHLPLLVVLNSAAAVRLGAAVGLPPRCCCAADSLASSLLALGTRVPGAATLLCNLCRAAPPAPPRERHRPWHDQYLHGMAVGIHACALGPGALASATWGHLSQSAFGKHAVLLLAWSRSGSEPPVLMPPGETVLSAGDVVWAAGGSAMDVRAALAWEAPPDPGADWRTDFHEAQRRHGAAQEHAALLLRRHQGDAVQQSDPGGQQAASAPVPAGFSDKDAVNDVADAGGHVVVINSGGDEWQRCAAVVAALHRPWLASSPPVIIMSPTAPPVELLGGGRVLCVSGTAQDGEAMLLAGVDTAQRVLYLAGGLVAGRGEEEDDATGGGGALDRRAVLSTNIVERHHEEWQRDVFLLVELRAPASIKYLTESVPRVTAPVVHSAPASEAPSQPVTGRGARRGPLSVHLAGALELTDLKELRHLLNKGLLTGQGALNALLGTELALLSAADAPALPPVRASPALHARYAAGRAFFATDVCRVAAHAFFCPGAVHLLHALADPEQEEGAAGASPRLVMEHLPVAAQWIGGTYASLFAHLQAAGALPLGLYRNPPAGHPDTLAYVFACPPPWVVLQADDVAYVLTPRGVNVGGAAMPAQ